MWLLKATARTSRNTANGSLFVLYIHYILLRKESAMSYCVNCGVELEPSLTECPLCNTPVINPKELYNQKKTSPYPKERGQVDVVKRKDLTILTCIAGRHILKLPSAQPFCLFKGSLVPFHHRGLPNLICAFHSSPHLHQTAHLYFSFV